jgi:hypothetical protein
MFYVKYFMTKEHTHPINISLSSKRVSLTFHKRLANNENSLIKGFAITA